MSTCTSFWNAETNWFDWLSLTLTIASLFFAWYISSSIYKKEKKDKKRDDKELLEQEYLFFRKNIERILPAINRQIEVFEQFPITNQFNRTISIDTAFMSYFDLKNFYVKNGLNKKNKTELDILNDLLINLNTLNDYYNKEKTVYLALQKINDLFPKLNSERIKTIKVVESNIKSKIYNQGEEKLIVEYQMLLKNIFTNSRDVFISIEQLNNDCIKLRSEKDNSSILTEIDSSYQIIRNEFINSFKDFNNEFAILQSNLQDTKVSIETYLNHTN